MNILYVTPDIPVPHTGEFVGGSTHVMKIAESLVKKGSKVIILSRRVSGNQKKYEEIGKNIFTRRIFRGLIFPIRGKSSSKAKEKGKFSGGYKFAEEIYFLFYRFVLFFLVKMVEVLLKFPEDLRWILKSIGGEERVKRRGR